MITNSDIVQIFRSGVPTGRKVAVRQIHQIVEKSWTLSEADWEPHPCEVARGSVYPAWKRKVQAVLHDLNRRRKVQHFPVSHEYIFDSSSLD
jgi:hypothetical protein